jgi:hypothetical protein
MGGDDSQKLLALEGTISSPGRSKPPAHNTVIENGSRFLGANLQDRLSYNLPGLFFESRGGSLVEITEAPSGSAILFG